MHLSTHFTLAEAERSMTADRLGLDNSVPLIFYPRLELIAMTVLEPIRLHFGAPFSPSSWFRSKEVNAALGGSETSFHPKALAVDVEVPGVPNDALFDWCSENLTFDQLIREFPKPRKPASGWVHIGIAVPGGIGRNQQFSIPRNERYER